MIRIRIRLRVKTRKKMTILVLGRTPIMVMGLSIRVRIVIPIRITTRITMIIVRTCRICKTPTIISVRAMMTIRLLRRADLAPTLIITAIMVRETEGLMMLLRYRIRHRVVTERIFQITPITRQDPGEDLRVKAR